ncbi:hypothetical protein HDU99_006289, partial [Rhizoclosmatium hyalinum]
MHSDQTDPTLYTVGVAAKSIPDKGNDADPTNTAFTLSTCGASFYCNIYAQTLYNTYKQRNSQFGDLYEVATTEIPVNRWIAVSIGKRPGKLYFQGKATVQYVITQMNDIVRDWPGGIAGLANVVNNVASPRSTLGSVYSQLSLTLTVVDPNGRDYQANAKSDIQMQFTYVPPAVNCWLVGLLNVFNTMLALIPYLDIEAVSIQMNMPKLIDAAAA